MKFQYLHFPQPSSLKERLEESLRQASIAYIHTALQTYVKLQGKVSLWNIEKFGDSANVVSALHRGVEHLLKLRLAKLDLLLLCPLPKKPEDYYRMRGIAMRGDVETAKTREEAIASSHSVEFSEALERVYATTDSSCDFKCFSRLSALRNSLEHHWDRNEGILEKVIGEVSTTVHPAIKEFISTVLGEKPEDYFDKELLAQVEQLDRALASGRSLAAQKKLDAHATLYAENPEKCRALPRPKELSSLTERELADVARPVCGVPLWAYWEWEADYDVEGSSGPAYVAGVYPDAKYVFCENCHLTIEGQDLKQYIPDEFIEEIMEEERDAYRDEYP
jgi:hypothetical protein